MSAAAPRQRLASVGSSWWASAGERRQAAARRALAAALAACGAGGGEDLVTLRLWAMGREGEDVRQLIPEFERPAGPVRMRLELVEPMGNEIFLHASAGEHELTARVAPQRLPEPGEEVALALDASRVHFFDPVTHESLRAESGSA